MRNLELYYATNRRHEGKNRWRPRSYGKDFSSDGQENLRFGRVVVRADAHRIKKALAKGVGFGQGDGNSISGYLTKQAKSSKFTTIRPFPENLNPKVAENDQDPRAFGSLAMFSRLQDVMLRSKDVLIFIHGYNVPWHSAVGSALALQEMLNLPTPGTQAQSARVVLFSWPSDGSMMPFAAYKSDRTDAVGSGHAVGRGFLKLRDFLIKLRTVEGHAVDDARLCNQGMHLLCHSMGNYVLQNALARLSEFTAGRALPRLFEHVFMCAADVDDDVLDRGGAMERLPEITSNVNVYFNDGDAALHISDVSKGNPDRLGTSGTSRPGQLHKKVHQVDCSPCVGGLVEHSYFLDGNANLDIRLSLAGEAHESSLRPRGRSPIANNTWVLEKD